MERERWRRVQEVFHAVAERPAAERAELLRTLCAGDGALAAEVEALLHADTPGDELLSEPSERLFGELAAGLFEPEAAPAVAGRTVGPYTLVRQLGRGGMGVVYLAERADVELRCALKVVRGELAAPEHLERFGLERRLLARLEHPHIARLLDAGVAPDGSPWFALEYVDGEPIDGFCDARRLGLDARLALFEQVCEAVAFSHHNLIVHRDLKPGNVLVSERDGPKLLDFGIAKLVEQPDEGLTRTHMRLLTPDYAAPEQLAGDRVTTATDVYALGVVLYELLCGHHPHEREHRAGKRSETRRFDTLPARPSTMVLRPVPGGEPATPDAPRQPAEIAAARATSTRELARRLAGDLDAIVLRALAPEPQHRYASAAELRDDLRNFRRGLPVRARPHTWSYQAGLFVRRHRAGVAVAASLVLLLAGFAASMAVQQAATARERDRAEAALARAELEAGKAGRVSGFLLDLFNVADPFQTTAVHADSLSVRDFLVQRGALVTQLVDQPEVQLAALNVVGRMYTSLGLYEQAEPLLSQAQELGARLYPQGDAERVATHVFLADHWRARQELDRAEQLYRHALEIARAIDLGIHRYTISALHQLGDLLRQRGELDEAESLLREALGARIELFGPESVEASDGLNNLGLVLWARRDFDQAAALLEEALAIQREKLPPPHAMTAAVLNNLGLVRRRQGALDAAEAALRESLAIKEQLLGRNHWRNLVGVYNLARLLTEKEHFAEAERLLGEVRSGVLAHYGENHDLVGGWHLAMGEIRERQGRYAEAEQQFRAAATLYARLYSPAHPDVRGNRFGLARVLVASGRLDEAVPLLEALAREYADAHGPDDTRTLRVHTWLGAAHAARGDRARAEPLLRQVVQGFRASAASSLEARMAAEYLARLGGVTGEP